MTRHGLLRWDVDAIAGWEREAPMPDAAMYTVHGITMQNS